MAASLSFRTQRDARPPHYRTPSPPRHAVEPLSPHPSPSYRTIPDASFEVSYQVAPSRKETRAFGGGDERAARTDYATPSVANNNGSGSMGKPGGHSRSGSTIDTLATVALATSPTFAPFTHDNATKTLRSPTKPPLPVLPDRDESAERPPKRARSEKARSPAWSRVGERPATSHISTTFDSMKTDAELLLNLARPSNRSPWIDQPPTAGEYSQSRSHALGPSGSTTVRMQNHPRDVVEEVPSSVFAHGSTVPPARIRSRSDGSAMVAKPTINGLMDGPYNQLPYPASAVDDGSNTGPPYPSAAASAPEPASESRTNRKVEDSQPAAQIQNPTAASPAECEMDVDSPSQAQCAACTSSRAPANSEDDADVTWVNCDGCNRWFHIVCAGFKDDREIRTVDKFICHECRPTHGPTTFLRKSTRPRTAIDYAGLNQGFVKSSAETPEHHYIRPIKEGRISFLPDKFARLPPELVSAEYFQRGVGMTEPIIIPAHLNSRHAVSRPGFVDDGVPLHEEVSQEEFDGIIDYLSAREDTFEEVVDCGQDLLDMVIPENLTVRNATELYGPEEPVEVIDVKSQQGEDKKWNMQKWADYYYERDDSKPIRNVISLEMSQSPLGRLIRRPKIVRDLDLQDSVWPADLQAIGDFPKVQFYCLMSVADCYTDFHIDFGGSSVFYHILKGKKTFLFIPPKDKHLKKYEEWCNSSSQDTTFLGDQTKECYRVDLSPGDTMLIPSGWIHAVWTPENSLVIGGNFLTRMNYGMQIKVAKIEKDTKVPMKFRYPFFQKIMWYSALKYLAEDPVPPSVLASFADDGNFCFYRECPIYYEFGMRANTAEPGSEYYNARFYSQAELEGLPDLARYLFRTALIAGGYPVDGVAKEARNAVNRSIPKGQGDPLDIARSFGVWTAWKRGNEPAAEWTRPGCVTLDTKTDHPYGKPNSRPSRRSERNVKLPKGGPPSSIQSLTQQPSASGGVLDDGRMPSDTRPTIPAKRKASSTDINNVSAEDRQVLSKGNNALGPKRMACESCRKRRIRCRHKDGIEPEPLTTSKQRETLDSTGNDTAADVRVSVAAQENVNGNLATSRPVMLTGESTRTAKLAEPTTSSAELGALYAPKKSRSKACDECRKSKRRCVHDEAGRIDPHKAHELSKSRVSNTVSKQASCNGDKDVSIRDNKSGTLSLTTASHTENASLQAAKASGSAKEPAEALANPFHEKAIRTESLYASPPAFKADSVPSAEDGYAPAVGAAAAATTGSLVSPPTSHSDEMDNMPMPDGQNSTVAARSSPHAPTSSLCSETAQHTKGVSRLSPVTNDEASKGNVTKLGSINSSMESAQSPVTGPSGDHGNAGKIVYRHERTTPSDKAKSTDGRRSRRSSSLASPSQHKPENRDRSSFTDKDADPESLKLIRELQEQEFSLRKRGSRHHSQKKEPLS